MAVYYHYDDAQRQNKNRAGRNFWYLYITEIFDRLGVAAHPLHGSELVSAGLGPADTLFLGTYALSGAEVDALDSAAQNGCTLVAFATCGCEKLFGVERCGEIPQPDDDFGLSGYFRLRKSLIPELLPIPDGGTPLPVFSDIAQLKPYGAETAADISLPGGESVPGLTVYKTGKAIAYYFAFDLPKTLWTSSAGKPVSGGSAGLPVSRVPDTRITPLDYDTSVAFGDYYVYILQSILAGNGEPMIHRLPPCDGTVPDYLIYIGGDDDATSGEMNLEASEIMSEKNLPYHMNLMQDGSGEFVITREQYELIKSRGHELALHYNFTGGGFTQEGFKAQVEKYVSVFGKLPVCCVGHCLTQEGWAERCRYQEALGILGDNSKYGEVEPGNINAFNMHGYAFGTAYPFFVRDDWEHGNRRMKFVELPVSYYEPRLYEHDTAEKLHLCADRSAYFGRMLNLFIHPHYVTGRFNATPPGEPNPALRAVDEILAYSKDKGYNVMLCGPDRLCKWWHGRAESAVRALPSAGPTKWYRVKCACEDGIVIKLPYSENMHIKSITIDGAKTGFTVKLIDGHPWVLFVIDKTGGHEVEVNG